MWFGEPQNDTQDYAKNCLSVFCTDNARIETCGSSKTIWILWLVFALLHQCHSKFDSFVFVMISGSNWICMRIPKATVFSLLRFHMSTRTYLSIMIKIRVWRTVSQKRIKNSIFFFKKTITKSTLWLYKYGLRLHRYNASFLRGQHDSGYKWHITVKTGKNL